MQRCSIAKPLALGAMPVGYVCLFGAGTGSCSCPHLLAYRHKQPLLAAGAHTHCCPHLLACALIRMSPPHPPSLSLLLTLAFTPSYGTHLRIALTPSSHCIHTLITLHSHPHHIAITPSSHCNHTLITLHSHPLTAHSRIHTFIRHTFAHCMPTGPCS